MSSKTLEYTFSIVIEVEKFVVPGGGGVGVGRAEKKKKKYQKINIDISTLK